jgi:hypothetical protein
MSLVSQSIVLRSHSIRPIELSSGRCDEALLSGTFYVASFLCRSLGKWRLTAGADPRLPAALPMSARLEGHLIALSDILDSHLSHAVRT